MNKIKYFFQFILIIIIFFIFKVLGVKISSFIGGKLFEWIGPIFRSKKIYKRYEHPEIIFKKKEKNLFSDSNQKSVKFFLNIVKQGKKLSKKRLLDNFLSNKIVLDICKKN